MQQSPVGYQGPPRLLLIGLCAAAIVLGAVLGLLTATRAGPVWDDAVEINVANAQLAVGSQPNWTYEEAKARIDHAYVASVYYGVSIQFLAHTIETLRDGAAWERHMQWSVRNITLRHAVSFVIVLIGISALIATIRITSGNWLLALCCGAVFLTTPVSLGMASINIKDGPVAIGLTLFSCGAALLNLLLLGRAETHFRSARAIRLTMYFAILLATAGAFLVVGTRAGAVALLGAAGVGNAIAIVLLGRKIWAAAKAISILAACSIVGVALAVAINPTGRKAPFQWLFESVVYASNVPNARTPVMLWGHAPMSHELPWYYVPAWIAAEYPLSFLALLLVGLVHLSIGLFRRNQRSALVVWSPFIVQGLVLPLLIVAAGAPFLDRLRHLFFLVPPLCMVAGYGLWLMIDGFGRLRPAVRMATAWVGAALLLWNAANTAIWYPYQYAYLNAVARLLPQFSFDTDYLGLSINEAVGRMRDAGVPAFKAGPAPIYAMYSLEGADIPDYGVEVSGARNAEPGGGEYFIHSRPSWGAAGLPEYCRPRFGIERQGVILGVGGTC